MTTNAKFSLLVFGCLLLAGTIGYRLIEDWPLLDGLYMTVITISTVGFGELRPLSPLGKGFTAILILLGVGNLAYAATKLTEAVIERRFIHRRRMQMEIKRLNRHVVVCGYGRMGRTVIDHLLGRDVPVVVIDKDAAQTARLETLGIRHIEGDATDDATLQQAGVDRAGALATVLPHDSDNLFVTLTARSMKPDLTIVARASNQKNESKMIQAGASRVLNPYRSGGRLMVRQLLHPSVTEFIDIISSEEEALDLEEVELLAGSSLAGLKLRDAPIRSEMDIIVVGVRRPGESLVFNPPPDLAPQEGDVLVVLGRPDNLRRLERLAEAR